jgi:hypothetical protein
MDASSAPVRSLAFTHNELSSLPPDTPGPEPSAHEAGVARSSVHVSRAKRSFFIMWLPRTARSTYRTDD